ncbi:MAG: biotin--[acetyl-CoA-carboxylase] ligase [Nitrosomonas sp.]|nr:biotin--[acetyl-CoA-carboxylase] ligase [Nitrosomonas sp.]
MNHYIFPILRILSDKQIHSCESLSESLNCPQSVISDSLGILENLGIKLIKIQNIGFHWPNPVVWLDSKKIKQNLNNHKNSIDIVILDFIGSTNDFLHVKSTSVQASKTIRVVAAELQFDGRGRLGRKWQSGLGDSLTFSLKWNSVRSAYTLSGLSLIVGVAIIRVLKSFSIHDVSIKWPNDVVFNYKKLAGILVEMRENALGSRDVIIGVGINFNLSKSLYRDVSSHICDLFDISGTIFDRNLIFGSLISELVGMLYSFEEHGFAYFKDEWIGYHAFEGKHAYLLLPDNSVIEGIIDGVSDDGALSLVTSRGREFYKVGDISLRLS